MKINNNSKYVLYIILFIIFILIRINYQLSSGEIENIGLKSLAISRCAWPFGIIFETALKDTFLPFYYLIIGILRAEILIKLFNIIISFANIYVFVLIGKKLLNKKLGIFLATLLIINHFFVHYTSLIAPWALIFLVQSCIINSLIDYLKKPTKRNFKVLNIFNFILILCDTFGFLFVLSEILILYLLGKRKRIYLIQCTKLFNFAFVAFLVVLPILITQYAINSKLIIPNNNEGIGLNLSAIYLMLSEYLTPHLSFIAPEAQTKSTLGLLYGYFLNPDIRNLNSLKILITLFYSTFLPIGITVWATIMAYKKNLKLKLIWLICAISTGAMLLLMLFEKIPTQPIYTSQFFLISLIILGYSIFKIKDKFTKIILIVCLLAIQTINPELDSFNITIFKNYTTLNPIKNFINDYEIAKNDLIVMPHKGKFGSFFFKKQKFFDYDNEYLKISKKKSIIRNISSKNTKSINKKNIQYLTRRYLQEEKINSYLMTYFTQRVFGEDVLPNRIVLVIDKLNSRPISQNTINKYANQKDYTWHPRKIDFRYADLSQNPSKNLYDALKSKTLYNFINILNTNFQLDTIVEYKKIDNEYYNVPSSNNIYRAINSRESDYIVLIYK